MTLPPGASDARRVDGGDINDAYRVTLADGSDAFVKTRAEAAPGEYAAEAAGLRWLVDPAVATWPQPGCRDPAVADGRPGRRDPAVADGSRTDDPGTLRVPRVLELDERYLALEWIDCASSGRLDDAGAERLGHGLAAIHGAGAPCFGMAGGAGARFGSLQLSNQPAADWPEFYANRRLRPLAALGRERDPSATRPARPGRRDRAVADGSRTVGVLSRGASDAVERVCGRLSELCGPAEPPARLHGDLWSGNVLGDCDGHVWLIDPCAYGGHREIDLAMLRLFGAPSERVFAAYEEVAPLAEGWRERIELYQLLPLLVHALLFGGAYAAAAERAARRYT